MSIFRSLTLYISDAGEVVSHNQAYPEVGGGYLWSIPIPVWVFLVLAIGFHILLKHTAFGRHVCAIGSSSTVAAYSAIKVKWIYFLTFVIAGVTVGISAVMLSFPIKFSQPR